MICMQVFKSRTPLKVVAARVAGVEIPNNKHAEYSIQYVFGIGPTRAKDIIAATVRLSPPHFVT